MKLLAPALSLLVLIASLAIFQIGAVGQAPAAAAPDQYRTMLNTYWVTCHNTRLKTSGIGPFGNRTARLVDGIEIVGPFNPAGVSRTPSRDLIITCDPKRAGETVREGDGPKEMLEAGVLKNRPRKVERSGPIPVCRG